MNIGLLLIAGSLLLIGIFMVIFFIIEKKRGREEVLSLQSPESVTKLELKKVLLSSSPLNEKLLALDIIAKEFFNQRCGTDVRDNYENLGHLLEKKNKVNQKMFCDKMIKVLYGGTELNQHIFNDLVSTFQRVVHSHEERMNALGPNSDSVREKTKSEVSNIRNNKRKKQNINKTDYTEIKRIIQKEKKSHKYIGSIDMLDRIERKINNLKKYN